jgi:hypothetical protein
METLYFGKSPEEVARDLRVNTIRDTATIDFSFVRMLAKIGYSYAVGAHGPFPREEVPVLPLILGASGDASDWLGSVAYTTEAERAGARAVLATRYHPLEGGAKPLLVARVKLFAAAGATGYEVVVRQPGAG